MMAFYKTPLGKKIIEIEPQAGEEVAKRAAGSGSTNMPMRSASKMRAEMKKKGHTEF